MLMERQTLSKFSFVIYSHDSSWISVRYATVGTNSASGPCGLLPLLIAHAILSIILPKTPPWRARPISVSCSGMVLVQERSSMWLGWWGFTDQVWATSVHSVASSR